MALVADLFIFLLIVLVIAWALKGKGDFAEALRFLALGAGLWLFMSWWLNYNSPAEQLNANPSEAIRLIKQADVATLKRIAGMYSELDPAIQAALDDRLEAARTQVRTGNAKAKQPSE